jgi:hypothetical protein
VATPFLNRIPIVRRLPVARLVLLAEVAILAGEHVGRLEPSERRRVVTLLRRARLRPGNLTQRERAELAMLVAKAEPKLFAKSVAKKFNPL